MAVQGVLFDLDGVIADTAKLHYQAWKKLANGLGIEIDEAFNEKLKGVDRANSLQRILDRGKLELSEQTKLELMEQKNNHYVELLETITSLDILPGITQLLENLHRVGIKIAIASISRNAPLILHKLGLMDFVDAIADPTQVANPKPAPDIFLLAADLIGVAPDHCIGVEDSEAGIEAIQRAGIRSVGIGVVGDITFATTKEMTISTFI